VGTVDGAIPARADLLNDFVSPDGPPDDRVHNALRRLKSGNPRNNEH
jgi:hypothetical protein